MSASPSPPTVKLTPSLGLDLIPYPKQCNRKHVRQHSQQFLLASSRISKTTSTCPVPVSRSWHPWMAASQCLLQRYSPRLQPSMVSKIVPKVLQIRLQSSTGISRSRCSLYLLHWPRRYNCEWDNCYHPSEIHYKLRHLWGAWLRDGCLLPQLWILWRGCECSLDERHGN